MSQLILIVEDETRIAHWVQSYFERAGFQTLVTGDGAAGLKLALERQPNLIILDLMLPGLDGIDFCKTLRRTATTPIIMLTAKGKELDRILGLELGADDYVVKPFSPDELVARARAVLRRVNQGEETTTSNQLRVGRLELDPTAHLCKVDGQEIDLSPTQFRLLETFMRNVGRTLTRQQLLDAAFEGDYDGFDRTIDAHIRRLRRAIEHNPSEPEYLLTVFGVGYKLVEERTNHVHIAALAATQRLWSADSAHCAVDRPAGSKADR